MPTTAGSDIELINGSIVVPLMLARAMNGRGEVADDGPITIQEALVASGAGAALSEWLEPVITEDWFPGIGLAYDAAPGCDTFSSPGYVLPGGASTELVLPATNSASPIVALVDHQNDLWIGQRGSGAANTGRVLRSVGGSAAPTVSLALGAGEYLKDLLVARNSATGVSTLWASSGSVSGDTGRMWWWDAGLGVWTGTAPGTFGTNGRNRMVTVFWEGEDGVGDWRIVTLASNQGHISYTRPGGDPMLAGGWVELVKVGAGEGIQDLVAAARHVWMHSARNLYDLDELGNSPGLTAGLPFHPNNIACVMYHDGFVYHSAGATLARVRVDQGPMLQTSPGICGPGFATQAKSGWLTGYPTALTTFLGGIVCATYSPVTGRSGVFWGVDRTLVGVETPNPLVWHGPFAHTSDQDVVTRMLVSTLESTPPPTKLYLASWNTSQAQPPRLHYVSMPSAGGAMNDLAVGGGHRFASGAGSGLWQQYSRLEGLATTVGDKGSIKFIHQLTIGSLGLGTPAGTKLTAYVRGDPAPNSSAWGTGVDVPSGPTYDVLPSTTSGHKMEGRVDFFSPGGTASPPTPAILDAIRTTFWRTAPDLDTWTFDCEYGDGVYSMANSHWPTQVRDVQWVTDALVAMARGDRVIMRDRQDQRWSVKVKHLLSRDASQHDGQYGKTVRARITLALLGPA